MKPCPHCNAPNRQDGKFCSNCGKSMAAAAPPPNPSSRGQTMQVSSPQKTVIGVSPSGGPVLLVRWPGGQQQEHPLSRGAVKVGRVPNRNQIVLNFGTISGEHLQFDVISGGIRVTDLNSRNGTQLNGRQMAPNSPQPFAPGDVLRVGDLQGNSISMTLKPTSGAQTHTRPLGLKNLAQFTTIILGRDPNSQIPLNHPSISRQHAEIQNQNGQYAIRDLGSSNGTFVDGQRIAGWVTLGSGSTIQIGPFKLSYDGQLQGLATFQSRGHQLDAMGLVLDVPDRNDKNKTFRILDDVSISVQAGEFVALVGGSGAGKSTLLKAMNGFNPATAGQMLIDGEGLYKQLDAYRTVMAYVPQDDIIHRELPVRTALWYAAKLRLPDASEQEIQHRIDEVLKTVDMTRHDEKPVRVLSGGQRKRVSIAVELLGEPDLLYLDEPTTGLDPGLEKKMMYDLNRLADQGKTVLLVTHATDNIEQCHHVAFMVQGHLAYYGPPDAAKQFFNAPHDFADIYLKLEEEVDPVQGPRDPIIKPYWSPQGRQGGHNMLAGLLWAQHYRRSPDYQKYVVGRQQRLGMSGSGQNQGGSGAKAKKDSVLRQTLLLARRNFDLIRQDKRTLFILLLMMPIIATLFMLISKETDLTGWYPDENNNENKIIQIDQDLREALVEDLDDDEVPEIGAKKDYSPATTATQILNMIGLALTQAGTFGAAYEIVKERAIFKRERSVNLRVTAYVLSKVLVLIGFAVIQVILTLAIFGIRVSLDVTPVFDAIPYGALELFITLLLATVASIMFGLFISATVPSTDVILYVILAQLLLQLVMAGTLFPLAENPVSKMVLSYWTMDGLATTVHVFELNEDSRTCVVVEEALDIEDGEADGIVCSPTPLDRKDISLYYERTPESLAFTWGVLGAQALFWMLLTILVQTRKTTA